MSSYEAFTLLKPPPKTHLKLHWRTHILSVPQLHVKNLILQEKRLVHFPQSSGMVMIVRKQSIPRKTITTVEEAMFYYIAAFSPSMYHQTPYSRHMNMPLQTPRQYKTTLVITQVADHVVFRHRWKGGEVPSHSSPKEKRF
ncbi:unnamed protein product [Brassica oleracea var. botrytis]|uniref:Uncharacterized protein n=2 Tax=Brassica TaxID=3705 RepID=A0A3P6CZJ1_BRAOL|nr:unnamed protein product [Brassica napus]VDD24083.1 unnamed protein product [Brassica oleracea]